MNQQNNVLLINVDHWSASRMGCAGDPVIMTPTLDQLAKNGVRFTNCFSTCPVCMPARRSLMTGTFPRTHGDRAFTEKMLMPDDITSMAQAFRDAGYQAYAVGKLHVYPQRNRIGFDDVILSEEARYSFGVVDDYQVWLGDHGYLGKEYAHGMSNNQYYTRPWHLPEEAHQTTWTTMQMVKMIKRKDPTRPAFFYASYVHPHPPLVPLQAYLDMYEGVEMPKSPIGDWISDNADMLKQYCELAKIYTLRDIERAKKAFYALCTHIDHQIRLLIGTLREEGLLDNTIIGFTSDHGDNLFDHGLVGKRNFYRNSTNVPLILTGHPLESYAGTVNKQVVCLEDIMPTLLSLCNIKVPETVEGINLFGGTPRKLLFGEVCNGPTATRMVTDGAFKLIYYPYGNIVQLFNIEKDPNELVNLAHKPEYKKNQKELTKYLIDNLHDGDEKWVADKHFIGAKQSQEKRKIDYGLYNQRGLHWPPPKETDGAFV